MKAKHSLKIGIWVTIIFLVSKISLGAIGGGNILGQVTDPDTKEPLAFATVVLESQGSQRIFTTNEFGFYYASNIPTGVYSLTVSYLSKKFIINDIKLRSDESRTLNIDFSSEITIAVSIVDKRGPKVLFDPADPQSNVLDGPQLRKMPIIGTAQIAESQSGITAYKGEYYVRGARAGSLAYYIDGCRIMGSPNIPLCGLDTYRTYTGFIPPKYGDCTGGVVVMESRNFFSEQ